MMMMKTDKNHPLHWTEYFRIVSPFLLLVVTAIGGSINTKLGDIDDKLFKHLTNDEIHTPKTIIVDKETFAIYQVMRDKQMTEISEDLRCIRQKLDKVK